MSPMSAACRRLSLYGHSDEIGQRGVTASSLVLSAPADRSSLLAHKAGITQYRLRLPRAGGFCFFPDSLWQMTKKRNG